MNFWRDQLERKRDIFLVLCLVSAVLAYVFYVFFYQKNSFYTFSDVEMTVKKIEADSQKVWIFDPLKGLSDFRTLGSSIKKKSFYEKLFLKDIFHADQVQVDDGFSSENEYVLIHIEKKLCPFIWMGFVQKEDSKVLFIQLNSKKETFFLKKDDRMGEYLVEAVTPHYVDLRKTTGNLLLRMKKGLEILEEPLRAKIYDRNSGRFFLVKEGEFLEGWSLHSILKDSVVLKRGELGLLVTKEGSSQQ